MKIVRMTLAMTFAVSLLLASGCETVKGVGRDIEAAGEELDESID